MQNQFQNVFKIPNVRTIRLATTRNASILAHSILVVSTAVVTYNCIELYAYVTKGSLAILNNIVVKVSSLNFAFQIHIMKIRILSNELKISSIIYYIIVLIF